MASSRSRRADRSLGRKTRAGAAILRRPFRDRLRNHAVLRIRVRKLQVLHGGPAEDFGSAAAQMPSCGKSQMKKLVSAPVFRLKGGGWYETDFKSDKENKRNLAVEKEPDSSTRATESNPEAKPVGQGVRQGRRRQGGRQQAARRASPRASPLPPARRPNRRARVESRGIQVAQRGEASRRRRPGRAPAAKAKSKPKRPRANADERAQTHLEPAALPRRGRARVAAHPRQRLGHHVHRPAHRPHPVADA